MPSLLAKIDKMSDDNVRKPSEHSHSFTGARRQRQALALTPGNRSVTPCCDMIALEKDLTKHSRHAFHSRFAVPRGAVQLPPKRKRKRYLQLRVGLGSSPVPPLPNSVNWLAKDLGFYQREGLEIELIELQGTPLAVAAMISGDIDVGNIVDLRSDPLERSQSPIPARDSFARRAALFSRRGARRDQIGAGAARVKPSRWRGSAASITPCRWLTLKALGVNHR